ncbi:MAG: pilus assembly FimT family protein [Fusobacteriaceae bacterium]
MREKYNSKTSGLSIIELVACVALLTIIVGMLTPTFRTFIKVYIFIKPTSVTKDSYRIVEGIAAYVASASFETRNRNLVGVSNRGLAVLKLDTRLVTYGINFSTYIQKINSDGDSLYIEIPEICLPSSTSGIIKVSNQFHLYRFWPIMLYGKIISQKLTYQRGKVLEGTTNLGGSRYLSLEFLGDDILMDQIYKGKFTEIKGGVIIQFELKNGEKIQEILLRSGEL